MSHMMEAKITVEIQALDELLATETERSIVLSVACFLEDRLRDLLIHYAGTPVPGKKQRPNDWPPTFYDLIGEARDRALLSTDVLHDMDKIRKIRNVFGHSFSVRKLADAPEAAKLCEELELPDKPGEEPPESIWVRARHRFDISARHTTQALVARIFEDRRVDRETLRARREGEEAARHESKP